MVGLFSDIFSTCCGPTPDAQSSRVKHHPREKLVYIDRKGAENPYRPARATATNVVVKRHLSYASDGEPGEEVNLIEGGQMQECACSPVNTKPPVSNEKPAEKSPVSNKKPADESPASNKKPAEDAPQGSEPTVGEMTKLESKPSLNLQKSAKDFDFVVDSDSE